MGAVPGHEPGQAHRHLADRQLELAKPFERRKLKPGTVIEVVVSVPDQIGKVLDATTRKNKQPKRITGCVAAGGTAAVAC